MGRRRNEGNEWQEGGGSFIDLCLWGNLHFLFLMSVQPNGVNLWYLKL